MRGLDHHLVGRQRQLGGHQPVGFALVEIEQFEQLRHIGVLEVVGRLLHLVLVEHIAIGHGAERTVGPDQVVDRVDTLQVHGQALEAIGDFTGDRVALDAADLLEVGELGDFHAVEPDFPAQTPGAEGRRFPVVLHEAHVVHRGVDADAAQRLQVQVLDVVRLGLSTTWNW